MQKSNFPDEGIAGGLYGARFACSQREIQSPVDPASFESYVELMRQGAAASARVAAAARILQREAHRTSLTAKAAMGALYQAGEDPFRLLNIQFTPPLKGRVMAEGDVVALHDKRNKEFHNQYTGDGKEEEERPDPKEEARKQAKKKRDLLKKAKEFARKHKKKALIAAAIAGTVGVVSAIDKKANGKDKKAPEPPKETPPEESGNSVGASGNNGGGYAVNRSDGGGGGGGYGAAVPNDRESNSNSNPSGGSSSSSTGGGAPAGLPPPPTDSPKNESSNGPEATDGWMKQMKNQGILVDESFDPGFNSAVASAFVVAREAIFQHAAASFMASRESRSSWHRKAFDVQSLRCFL